MSVEGVHEKSKALRRVDSGLDVAHLEGRALLLVRGELPREHRHDLDEVLRRLHHCVVSIVAHVAILMAVLHEAAHACEGNRGGTLGGGSSWALASVKELTQQRVDIFLALRRRLRHRLCSLGTSGDFERSLSG